MCELSDHELDQKLDSKLVENLKTDYEPTSENILEIPISETSEDNHAFEECQIDDDDVNLCASETRQENGLLVTSESEIGVVPTKNRKVNYGLAKQEHAFAGALAGLSVSLCLHPIDTVKTVIQTCRANQNSINYIARSIISERGLTGLYRGIATNIASSAPISAVYAFTYESVKGVLLPLLPIEYVKNISASGMQTNHGFDGQINACWLHKMSRKELEVIRSAGFLISVIHGRHDIVAQLYYGKKLAQKLHPFARMVELHGGHQLSHERTEEVNQALSELIKATEKKMNPYDWTNLPMKSSGWICIADPKKGNRLYIMVDIWDKLRLFILYFFSLFVFIFTYLGRGLRSLKPVRVAHASS